MRESSHIEMLGIAERGKKEYESFVKGGSSGIGHMTS
jgi:hypothetical protein